MVVMTVTDKTEKSESLYVCVIMHKTHTHTVIREKKYRLAKSMCVTAEAVL